MSYPVPRQIRFVIPAAGCSHRLGGIPKELLPINQRDCGLTNAVRLAHQHGNCPPIVVTTNEKRFFHKSALDLQGLKADFVVKERPEDGDMWGSVLLGMDRNSDGGLIMPDTIPTIQEIPEVKSISFGVFPTWRPDQFSCLNLAEATRPKIETKIGFGCKMAWGVVVWSAIAVDHLQRNREHYDKAFESIMREIGYGIFQLSEYADIGTFESYREYLKTTEGI